MPSGGGLLLDGSGEVATTPETGTDDIVRIVRSRLKAALHGWQLYPMGADLPNLVGQTVGAELDITIERQVVQCLTYDGFLAPTDFSVQTLSYRGVLTILVYLQTTLIATASLTNLNTTPTLQITSTTAS